MCCSPTQSTGNSSAHAAPGTEIAPTEVLTNVHTYVTIVQVKGTFAGFAWDDGNRSKCLKHGVSLVEIESLFEGPVMLLQSHSSTESRIKVIGKSPEGRHVFLVFTIREREGRRFIRPISARYMHRKEIRHYEEENPGF
jgi:uncharacterized protein